jgi:hypothetical protein
MKKFLLSVATVAVALAFTLPSRAADEAKPEKPKKHEYTGEIVSVDTGAKTVTVKKKDGDQKTFMLDEKVKVVTTEKEVAEIGDLKVSEKVKITYTIEDDGKLTAHKIGIPDSMKKKQKKEEEAKD